MPEPEGARPVEHDRGEGRGSGDDGACEEPGEVVDGEVQACADIWMRHKKRMRIFFTQMGVKTNANTIKTTYLHLCHRAF